MSQEENRVASAFLTTGALAKVVRRKIVALALCVLAGVAVAAQGTVVPADLLKPSTGSWPMYNGDYSGRRFSPLTKIDTSSVSSMTRRDSGNVLSVWG